MSDDEQAIYIGNDDSSQQDIYPSLSSSPTQKIPLSQTTKQFKVLIRQFQILKQTYIVHTETQIYKVQIFLDNKEYLTIHRRFSDFEFLFDIIQERYPGLIIPGFQEKTLFSYFEAKISHLEKSIIDIRMVFLCRFFSKILNIDILKNSREIENFISVDEQFQIFKKSNIGNIKKKGFIGNILTTATNMFKTKKVDSKYEKFLEEGVVLLKELEKVEKEFNKYPESILEEVLLIKNLKETNPDVFLVEKISAKFQRQIELSTKYNGIMEGIIDELVYCELDVKYYVGIVEKRYELKESGEERKVMMLEKTFEAQKDGFLEFIKSQLKKVKKELQKLVIDYKEKSKEIWKM